MIAANGAAPFTVDLETQTISGPGGPDITFDIPAADRMRLLEGLDDIGLTLKHTDEIEAWEKRTAAAQPWLQTARRQPAIAEQFRLSRSFAAKAGANIHGRNS